MELDILQALSHKGIIMSEPNCMLLLKHVLSRRLFWQHKAYVKMNEYKMKIYCICF